MFAITGGLGILGTLAVQRGVEFFLVLMAVSGICGIGLMQVRYRGRIVLVGALAALAAFAMSSAMHLLDGQALQFSLMRGLWAGASTLMAAFVIEGILPGIERVFRLSTGMTLLEWCDANKPLLRMMAAEAPGTFNHSMMVATLAEAAAEEIGANGLLARAGAYYHDIGKINKPEYFVENQTAGVNRHEKLSPAMSVLVIVGHVKDGIEMAKEYNLPESLHPFIAEHHGTTLVQYFYHAAAKQRKESDPEIAEAAFRYPGPRPQSKETAIVMLCDAVEGAVRAMPEPTPNRIEDTVSKIVQARLMDGQLDDCDMTFRELARVEASLVKSLCSIYHGRIAYPSQSTQTQSAAS
ncbi:MAG: HDIG domain-containing protein [Planctomycetota bacterium]|nr:MAG: HDIG domain-containing protein [Planctomycetota bacterium]